MPTVAPLEAGGRAGVEGPTLTRGRRGTWRGANALCRGLMLQCHNLSLPDTS